MAGSRSRSVSGRRGDGRAGGTNRWGLKLFYPALVDPCHTSVKTHRTENAESEP